jgi:hypothetical protein
MSFCSHSGPSMLEFPSNFLQLFNIPCERCSYARLFFPSLRGRLSGFGGGDEKWEEKKIGGGHERESLP